MYHTYIKFRLAQLHTYTFGNCTTFDKKDHQHKTVHFFTNTQGYNLNGAMMQNLANNTGSTNQYEY